MIHGSNCANAIDHFTLPVDPTLVSLIRSMFPAKPVFRFPGGTLSQSWRISSGELPKMVALAKACDASVLWVANLVEGTTAETLEALTAFRAAGIRIEGVEIGNEMYLKQYRGFVPTGDVYLFYAKQVADAIRERFPTLPVGITMAPPPVLRDLGDYPAIRIDQWNAHLYKCTWANALVLHCYTAAALSVEYTTKLLPKAFTEIGRNCALPVWVTEFNLTDHHGEPIQGEHYDRCLKRFSKDGRVTIATVHNCLGAGVGYNLIQAKKNGPGKPITYSPTSLGMAAKNFNAE